MSVDFTSATRMLALLGDPVSHSLSPVIQNAAFREAGVDGVYVAMRCGADDLSGLLQAIARAGGGGNVTLPHKERAAAVVDRSAEAVTRTGACNTFWEEDGQIVGDNTDVEGFSRAVRALMGESVADARVLLLGAGGAARAALVALLDERVGEVSMLNRTTERARAVARRMGGDRTRVLIEAADVEGEDFDLVVNATRLGLDATDPSPLDLDTLGHVSFLIDLLYGSHDTALRTQAKGMGITSADGIEMLVQQAAVAFERWWRVEPSVDAMREALRQARG